MLNFKIQMLKQIKSSFSILINPRLNNICYIKADIYNFLQIFIGLSESSQNIKLFHHFVNQNLKLIHKYLHILEVLVFLNRDNTEYFAMNEQIIHQI